MYGYIQEVFIVCRRVNLFVNYAFVILSASWSMMVLVVVHRCYPSNPKGCPCRLADSDYQYNLPHLSTCSPTIFTQILGRNLQPQSSKTSRYEKKWDVFVNGKLLRYFVIGNFYFNSAELSLCKLLLTVLDG